jgi:hypothetical protein
MAKLSHLASSPTCADLAHLTIADAMDVSAKTLDNGYEFSTHPAHDSFHNLSSPAHWLDLIQKASEAVERLSTSKVKVLKPFEVQLKSFNVGKGAKTQVEKSGKRGLAKDAVSGKGKGKG